MSGIDERRKGMDAKLHHDDEMRFRLQNRRNRLVGAWAAERLALSAEEAEAYAQAVVAADFKEPGDEDVVRKILADFEAAGQAVTVGEIRAQLAHLATVARQQLIDEA